MLRIALFGLNFLTKSIFNIFNNSSCLTLFKHLLQSRFFSTFRDVFGAEVRRFAPHVPHVEVNSRGDVEALGVSSARGEWLTAQIVDVINHQTWISSEEFGDAGKGPKREASRSRRPADSESCWF